MKELKKIKNEMNKEFLLKEMETKKMDRNKFVKVFNLDVQAKKEVSKEDVIISLLDEGEIAFNGGDRGTFVLKINDDWTFDMLKTLVWNSIREYKNGKEKK